MPPLPRTLTEPRQEVDVIDHQPGKLGKPDARVQEQLDDGPFARSLCDVTEQRFQLLFGIYLCHSLGVARRWHSGQGIGVDSLGLLEPTPEAPDGADVGVDRGWADLSGLAVVLTGRFVLQVDDVAAQVIAAYCSNVVYAAAEGGERQDAPFGMDDGGLAKAAGAAVEAVA